MNARNVFIMIGFFFMSFFLIACGDNDSDNDNEGTNVNQEANNNDTEDNAESIDLPEVITEDPSEWITSFNDIFNRVKKMDIEWEYAQEEGEEESYSLYYELLDEVVIDGEPADHVKIIFEDKILGDYLEAEFDYTKTGQLSNFEGDLTGEAANDYPNAESYLFQSVLHDWTYLFMLFDHYRTMLVDESVPLLSYESESGTVGESGATIHYIQTGNSGTLAGSNFSDEKLEIAAFDDFELMLSIEQEDRTKLSTTFNAFEVR